MRPAHALVPAALALILAVPFALRPRGPAAPPPGTPTLVIITPHVQQIRHEFADAFARWHLQHFGSPVAIDWRQPGGTSDIMRLLQARFAAAIDQGRFSTGPDGSVRVHPGAIGFDVMFGGGSYDHTRLKQGRGVHASIDTPDGQRTVPVPMSAPPDPPFPQSQLDEWFGPNRVGTGRLYDPDQHWFGTALSSFGIVYNRDVLARLGIPEPASYQDLCNPALAGWIALADPRQSGSVTTAYNAILDNLGWETGWNTLRELAANARYFTASSTRPPIDVSQGDAAAGVAIDFYGRAQAQAVTAPGQSPDQARVAFVDPADAPFIDADPVSIINGTAHPELARRFVRFCCSDLAQSLWQFSPGDHPDGLGPSRYTLRRLPVKRSFYQRYLPRFVDRVDPFSLPSDAPDRRWRPLIAPCMAAFAIDTHDDLRHAWNALNHARNDPQTPPDALAEMERLFYAFPTVSLPDGTRATLSPDNAHTVADAWRDPVAAARARIDMARQFRDNYRAVVRLARSAR